jgi:predicted nucleic acid-binding protein
MPERPVYVLDSFALLAHLEDESGKGRVRELLEAASQGHCRLLLSIINLGEVIYITERERGLATAQVVLAALEQLPVEVLPADRPAVLAAAHLKAHYRLSFADAFAASAAQAQHATLVTGDPEFQALADQLSVEWLLRGD